MINKTNAIVNLADHPRFKTDDKMNNKSSYGSGGGDMGDGDGIESRVARLEADVSHIQRDISDMKSGINDIKRDMREDFRIAMSALITMALGLAGLMAKGFHWL